MYGVNLCNSHNDIAPVLKKKNNVYNLEISMKMFNFAQIKNMEQVAMASLGKKASRVYELSRFDGLSIDEIAEKMHAKRRTIESHLYLSSG